MTPPAPIYGSGLAGTHQAISHLPAVLDVVAVVSNPARFRSRYKLYRDFARYVDASGARLTTVECAHGARPFEVTRVGNPSNIQVRTNTELWLKENLINIGISRLPSDWKYVAWVDADITFARPDWVQETLQQLQHHPVVQMWSHAQDLGPDYEPLQMHESFAYSYRHGSPPPPAPGYYHRPGPPPTILTWHPGFSWAARREAIDALGGLIDWAILGAGDHHMAKALIGKGLEAMPPGISDRYKAKILHWQDRAEKFIKHDIGYVSGLLLHAHHGPKVSRRYWDRWRILVGAGYDPDLDIKKDSQGLIQLTDRSPALRDGIRAYFAQRNEDSNTV